MLKRAYHSLKVAVTTRPVLHLANIGSKFVLRAETSHLGLGAALMQRSLHVAYACRKMFYGLLKALKGGPSVTRSLSVL
ncbi:retrovirus-related pol polyprotein from transposon 297 family [Plakobranchus ocellatus]|uniref:Retrovirus-related pol polyprotein from transposon 297 family n=1 Tax=Plakobranchus ocellatus TaxID=259542 RepID=A0AAV4BF93_9GAST|nr:retrovirus-related pol polyprotein from transposon 297 family [Plakobranchus ocellatus]